MGEKDKTNIIQLKDGVIHYKQIGDQSLEKSIKSVQAISLLSADMTKILIFADYQDSGKMDADSLKGGWYAFKNIDFHKIAVLGASPYLVTLLNTMARTTGKGKRLHFVKTRAEAIEWLKR